MSSRAPVSVDISLLPYIIYMVCRRFVGKPVSICLVFVFNINKMSVQLRSKRCQINHVMCDLQTMQGFLFAMLDEFVS